MRRTDQYRRAFGRKTGHGRTESHRCGSMTTTTRS
jgi:hypothetical protein